MGIIYHSTFVFKCTACLILAVSRELEQKPPVLQLAAASSALRHSSDYGKLV